MNIKLLIAVILSTCVLVVAGIYVYLVLIINFKYGLQQITISGSPRIVQSIFGGDIAITTSKTNYAVAEHSFASRNIKTISVNEHQVVMYSPTCQVITKTTNELDLEEQSALVDAKLRLSRSQESENSSRGGMRSSSYSVGSGEINILGIKLGNLYSSTDHFEIDDNYANNIVLSSKNGLSSYSGDGISIVKTRDSGYSLASRDMPNNLARIFRHHDVVAFVYKSGWVQMKPETCLTLDERAFLLHLKETAERAEKGYNKRMDRKAKELEERMTRRAKELEKILAQESRENLPYYL